METSTVGVTSVLCSCKTALLCIKLGILSRMTSSKSHSDRIEDVKNCIMGVLGSANASFKVEAALIFGFLRFDARLFIFYCEMSNIFALVILYKPVLRCSNLNRSHLRGPLP